MKRLLLLCLTYIMCVGNHQMAAQDSSEVLVFLIH